MSAPSSPTWLLAASRRRASYADLRLSDAERAEVADLLSKNYGDGRLDQAEFDQRLDQAMKAKTYKDLDGLFTDLPRAEEPGLPDVSTRRRHGHQYQRVLFLALVVVIAAAVGHALVWSFHPGVWVGLLVVLIVFATRNRTGPQ
jgi:hypothetical protein